ncbi:uncharacterized protein LOC133831680 [Humulus lupulus]|uniref:uncharacterized protein LOC133831680 n=1 Tax=Humulus lupulus TaxID=3486 RepID=UPI002B417AD9|nr:uncharacterized protein LOC133831680 [Humulus lupulus]
MWDPTTMPSEKIVCGWAEAQGFVYQSSTTLNSKNIHNRRRTQSLCFILDYLPTLLLEVAGMATVFHGSTANSSMLCERGAISLMGISALPLLQTRVRVFDGLVKGKLITQSLYRNEESSFQGRGYKSMRSKRVVFTVPRCSGSSDSNNSENDSSNKAKTPFGYNRKDVILIGIGVTALGVGLKSGLEFVGVDPLQAGNVVQLVLVLGLTIGWISTYIFRVSNKEMTYAQQLRDYESKVMEKRLEGLTEAELEALLEQVEEEKRLASGEQVK